MKRLALLCFAALAACGKTPEPQGDPIVIYAPGEAGSDIAAMIAEFTEETGVLTSVRWGGSSDLTDAVINKTGVPADILLTDNIADIWRAADKGALRPISSAAIQGSSEQLRDLDGYWGAYDVRTHMVVANKQARPLIGDTAELASADMNGRICLSSSSLADNRALIAMMIDETGVRETERLFRKIVTNMSTEPYESARQTRAALRNGDCDYGILAVAEPSDNLTHFVVSPLTFTAEAFGVGRHARSPESAQLFVDWMFRTRSVELNGDADWPHASIAGYRDEEARLLAERAGWH